MSVSNAAAISETTPVPLDPHQPQWRCIAIALFLNLGLCATILYTMHTASREVAIATDAMDTIARGMDEALFVLRQMQATVEDVTSLDAVALQCISSVECKAEVLREICRT